MAEGTAIAIKESAQISLLKQQNGALDHLRRLQKCLNVKRKEPAVDT